MTNIFNNSTHPVYKMDAINHLIKSQLKTFGFLFFLQEMFKFSSLFLNGNGLLWCFYTNRLFKSTSNVNDNQIHENLFNFIILLGFCILAIVLFSLG